MFVKRKYKNGIIKVIPMKVAIVSIAKYESNYIYEFVNYHLNIGFDTIYLYDNEDTPTYNKILTEFLIKNKIKIIHIPYNNYKKGVQYIALDHFIKNFMYKENLTHMIHLDIDEFICLKKHKNIKEIIKEYIKGNIAGIGINWRFFGSNNLTKYDDRPLTVRFTKCAKKGDILIKTLFDISKFHYFFECHSISPIKNYFIVNTKRQIINGARNYNIDLDIIQLNHYKCKTLPEFKYIRTRGRADFNNKSQPKQKVEKDFKHYDLNDIECLIAQKFYLNCLKNIK